MNHCEERRRQIADDVANEVVNHLRNRFGSAPYRMSEEGSQDAGGAIYTPGPIRDEDLDKYHTAISVLVANNLSTHWMPDLVLENIFSGDKVTDSDLAQFNVMLDAMRIYHDRNARYSDSWKMTGWKGTIFDIYKKASRLWVQYIVHPSASADMDDAYDLINFACFFIRGHGNRETEEWG